MWLIEVILKRLTKKKNQPPAYNPYNSMQGEEMKDYEACEHVFMPVDSTGETLSCTNCGLLVKRSELKNQNFFMDKDN